MEILSEDSTINAAREEPDRSNASAVNAKPKVGDKDSGNSA